MQRQFIKYLEDSLCALMRHTDFLLPYFYAPKRSSSLCYENRLLFLVRGRTPNVKYVKMTKTCCG